MKLTVDVTGIEQVRRTLLKIGTQMANTALEATAEDLELYIGNEAGKHTRPSSEGGGKLFQSVDKWRVPGGWEVGHDLQIAKHALFVHWGTRPHKIKAKGKAHGGKDLLRFVIGNRFVSKHEVNHPGYKGDAWLERAARQAPSIFERHVSAQLDKLQKGG